MNEIIKLTGTFSSSSSLIEIPYPNGYSKENTYVISYLCALDNVSEEWYAEHGYWFVPSEGEAIWNPFSYRLLLDNIELIGRSNRQYKLVLMRID